MVLGKRIPISNYKEGLFTVVQELQAQHPDFVDVATRVKGNGPYFSAKREDLRIPEKLKQGKLFIETNQDSNRKWKICQDLVRYLGHNPEDPSVLSFEVQPTRTRHRNRRFAVIDFNELG